MVALAAGYIVLVPFPFSDLSQSKLRPAVVRDVGALTAFTLDTIVKLLHG